MNKIHKFLIVKELIEEDDPDTEVTTLYFVVENDEKEEVLKGDYYHDKIDDKIEGFFEGLEFAGVNCAVSMISWED